MVKKTPRKVLPARNRLVAFIEFCGKHPFATGLFAILGVIGFVFSIFTEIQSNEDTENLQNTVSSVESIVKAACRAPPCWTAGQAIERILGSTKDLVDSKLGAPTSRTAAGWHYPLDGCQLTVHYVQDSASFFSHPLSTTCPFSWKEQFDIDRVMPPSGQVAIGHLLDAIFSDAYPPELHIATGCTNCGNWHEPYIEFRIPGPHASNFYDRYFTTTFNGVDGSDSVDNNNRFEERLRADTSLETDSTLHDFCSLDVARSAAEALKGVRVDSVGYGRGGWHGRPNYPIDICAEGYVAGPP